MDMKCNGICKYSCCMIVLAARGKETRGDDATDGAETRSDWATKSANNWSE